MWPFLLEIRHFYCHTIVALSSNLKSKKLKQTVWWICGNYLFNYECFKKHWNSLLERQTKNRKQSQGRNNLISVHTSCFNCQFVQIKYLKRIYWNGFHFLVLCLLYLSNFEYVSKRTELINLTWKLYI